MQPENEQGVIVLFAQQAERAGYEIISIGVTFPDAIIRHDGQEYRVEFEFKASSFKIHAHDYDGCDFIICWENDWPDPPVPIIALSEDDWHNIDVSLTGQLIVARDHWRARALKAENELEGIKSSSLDGRPGRPRNPINPAKLEYYLERGPENVSIRAAREDLGLSRRMHCRYRDIALSQNKPI